MEHLKKESKATHYVISAFIGKERYEFIKKNNLSVTKIIKEAIDRLIKASAACLLLSMVSCGGSAGGSSTTTTSDTGPTVTTGTLYAKAVSIQKEYSLGFDLSYSCQGDLCSFAGELHHYRYNNNDVTRTQITTASLTKSGDYYVGIIYTTSGQQFNASVKINQNFIKIDDGVNCTRSQSSTNQNGYDSFLGSVTVNDGSLQFNALTIGQCEL